MKIKLILIFVVVTLFTCQGNKIKDKVVLLLDLPDTSKTHQPDISYEIKKKAVEGLNLNKLENGLDSFELRLWTKVEVTNGGQVLVIKKINNNWTCLDYFYIESHGDFVGGHNVFDHITDLKIDTFWVKKKQPKSNWTTFFKDIQKEKIYELPDQKDVDGWKNIVTDGYTFYVEFADKYKYKFYSYNCPDVYEDNFRECKYMANILNIFDREFGLKLLESYRCRKK